jgi:hypothetical protein
LSNKWILSATEIEVFDTCRRKWAYQYLDGKKPPSSKAAIFGLAVHGFLQKYLTGHSIDYHTPEGRVASAGLHYLPKDLPKENVERPISFIKQGNIFHGYIDFFEQVGSQTWLIGDHKTTSNLNRVPTSSELKRNTQSNIYAQWAFTEKAADTVKLSWVYYRTQSTPKAQHVEATLSREEADANFDRISATANEIKSIVRDRLPSSDQPKNTSACFKYGRCAFFATCRRSTRATTINNDIPLTKDITEFIVPFSEPKPKSFHLYVDCVPTKNEAPYERTIELSELLGPVLTKIQIEKELSHYRLAGYGQHVGLIANYLSDHLLNNTYDDRIAILSSVKTAEGCDTLQTLTAAASKVVRGF